HHHGRPSAFLEQHGDAFGGGAAESFDGGGGAARTEHDVGVALGYDVFGGQDELGYRSHMHAALEQHQDSGIPGHFPDLLEQPVVQRAARSDLQAIHLGFHADLQLFEVHHLGIDGQARALPGFQEDFQALRVALEGMRGGTGLPYSAPDHVGPGFLDAEGRFQEQFLLPGIDRAMAGDDAKIPGQDLLPQRDAVMAELALPGHELVGRLNAIDALDIGEAFD